MVFISKKQINGKIRYYLEKSIRLPGGKIKKFSAYLKNYKKGKRPDITSFNKLHNSIINSISILYKKSSIFDETTIKKLERIKLEYAEIKKNLNRKQLQDIIDRFTVNFTYESNAIEGNSLTLKNVSLIFHENKALKDKDLREVYETLNTREAIKLIFNNKLRVNEKDIIRLHKILMENSGVLKGYKKFPNFILGRNTPTVPPEKVKHEMDKLIEWYATNNDMHPLQKAAVFHGKFEKIHPFEDGNGRVGRLLIDIILLNNSYPPLIIRKTDRLSYFSALESFDCGHEDRLSRFLIDKYKNTFKNFFQIYMKYIK